MTSASQSFLPHIFAVIAATSPWLYGVLIAGLALHIAGGGIGILSGWGAVLAAKGEKLHRLFGKLFVAAMTLMAVAAIALASQLTALKPMELGNIGAGVLVLYLLSTSFMAVRRAPNRVGTFDRLALAAIAALAIIYCVWGVRAMAPGGFDGYGSPLYFVFGGVAALFTAFDVRMIRNGGVSGSARIARHLVRMCTAWFIASASFFEGQQKVMPVALHGSNVLLALALAPLAFLVFWFVRVRLASRRTAAA